MPPVREKREISLPRNTAFSFLAHHRNENKTPNFSVKRMAAGGAGLRLRTLPARRHPLNSVVGQLKRIYETRGR